MTSSKTKSIIKSDEEQYEVDCDDEDCEECRKQDYLMQQRQIEDEYDS